LGVLVLVVVLIGVVALVVVLVGVVVGLGHLGHMTLVRLRRLSCCGSVQPMTSTLSVSYFLADTARTAGAVTATVLGFGIAVALIVLGVLLALGGLSSLAGVAG